MLDKDFTNKNPPHLTLPLTMGHGCPYILLLSQRISHGHVANAYA